MEVPKARVNFPGQLLYSFCVSIVVVTAIIFKFEFFKSCRLDFQARPHLRGASAFRNLVAKLPPRAHSIYYRDDIGNISTSSVWGDPKKVDILIDRTK